MSREYVRKFKKLLEKKESGLVGTVLSVDPIRVSCYDGNWVLEGEDLQIASHVDIDVGDAVTLTGEDPFTITAVVNTPDEYRPFSERIVDALGSAYVTDTVEDGNYAPITSNAVFRMVGNLEALLSDI